MEKITIVTTAENEGIVLDILGKLGCIHPMEINIPLEYQNEREEDSNLKVLHSKVNSLYSELSEYFGNIEIHDNDINTFNNFIECPERLIEVINEAIFQVKQLKKSNDRESKALEDDFNERIEEQSKQFEDRKNRYEKHITLKALLNFFRATRPEDLDSLLSICVLKNNILEDFIKYFKINNGVSYKVESITPEKSLVFIFGDKNSKKRVDSILLFFEAMDIFDFLDIDKGSLLIDPENRRDIINKFQREFDKLDDNVSTNSIEETYEKNSENIKIQYGYCTKKLESEYEDKIEEIKNKFGSSFNELVYLNNIFKKIDNDRLPIFRTKLLSILQGWIPEDKKKELNSSLEKIKSEKNTIIYVEYEEPSKDENPPSIIKTPSLLKPFYVLTKMLGIPNAREFNPTLIFTIIWVFMFGFMFPDIGQGILIATIGVILVKKVNRRMMGLNFGKLGNLFIVLGISSTIFGALFGDFFLIEIHPLLFKPMRNAWTLIKIAFYIGIFEITFAFILGIINKSLMGDKLEALTSEKGLGGLITFTGIMGLLAGFWSNRGFSGLPTWPYLFVLLGMTLVMINPVIHAKANKEKVNIMETIFEGIGVIFENLISQVSNTVSFIRLAGFCIAHVALAEVVLALSAKSTAMGILGLVFMNLLALSIEFLVVIIQALRLLYYEFSLKFYLGDGQKFKPFSFNIINQGEIQRV